MPMPRRSRIEFPVAATAVWQASFPARRILVPFRRGLAADTRIQPIKAATVGDARSSTSFANVPWPGLCCIFKDRVG